MLLSMITAIATTQSVQSQQKSAPPLRNTSGKRIVVLISGSGSNLQALIDATHLHPTAGPLAAAGAHISVVISNRKAAYGLQRAASANPPIPHGVLALKTWQNRNPGGTREQYDEVLAKAVITAGQESADNPPDLVVLAGFMHIVSPTFLRALGHPDPQSTEADSALETGSGSAGPAWRPKKPVPIINLHPALPGAFDGANAIERAFNASVAAPAKDDAQDGTERISHTGVMVHEVVAEVDRGAPVVVREVPIHEDDTLEKLEERMHAVEHELIVEGVKIMLERMGTGEGEEGEKGGSKEA